MDSDSGRSVSVWMKMTEQAPAPMLQENLRVDVCVVGAGIAGMSVAYMLSREGRRVIVLDDGPIGGGETCRTTAHLSNAIDDRYVELERLHGRDGARLAAESHTAAIEQIGRIVGERGIDCDYEVVDGYLFVPPGESTRILDQELDAARRAGLGDVALIERAPIDAFDTGPCLRFPRQAQFDPMRYLAGLASAIHERGGEIYANTAATKVQGGHSARVETAGGFAVEANAIVVATNSPINDMFAIHTKQAPYRTYAIGARVPVGAVTRALYWDTPAPYHYVRLQPLRGEDGAVLPHELLIIGGEDHKTGHAGDAEEAYEKLERWTRQRWPQMEEAEFCWSGQVMEPIDGLAFIGHNPMDEPNVFIASGDSGHGMTHGTIAGMLITDLILGRPNPWKALYEPARKTLRAAGDFLKENLDVAAQYADYARPAEVSSTDEILPGWGAILRRGLKRIAVHRDAHGHLHQVSAVCTHMGCIVRWNAEEQSWDCPCHGSRFAPDGHVLNGPAVGGLTPMEQQSTEEAPHAH